jgi:hypothetical protein
MRDSVPWWHEYVCYEDQYASTVVGYLAFALHVWQLLLRCCVAMQSKNCSSFGVNSQLDWLLGRVIIPSQGRYSQENTNTDKTHSSVAWAGFESKVSVFEGAKMCRASDSTTIPLATVFLQPGLVLQLSRNKAYDRFQARINSKAVNPYVFSRTLRRGISCSQGLPSSAYDNTEIRRMCLARDPNTRFHSSSVSRLFAWPQWLE